RKPKELDRGPGPVGSAERDDCCRRSQEVWRARPSPGNQETKGFPGELRSGAENRDIRPGSVRSDDGAIPGLGSQSVVVDVRIPGRLAHAASDLGTSRETRKANDAERPAGQRLRISETTERTAH